jgi:hypothetical protein
LKGKQHRSGNKACITVTSNTKFSEGLSDRRQALTRRCLLVDTLELSRRPSEQRIRSVEIRSARGTWDIVYDLKCEVGAAMQLQELRKLDIAHHFTRDDFGSDDEDGA